MKNKGILLEVGTNELEIAEFKLIKRLPDGREQSSSYGINVAKVREVIRYPIVTDYPKGGEFVIGVFKSRDKIVPLINLAKWLGLSDKEVSENQFVIVTDFNGSINGFLIDEIIRIHRVSWENIEPANDISLSGSEDCIVASVELNSNLAFILDFEKIVASINSNLDMSLYKLEEDPNINLSEDMKNNRNKHTILLVDDSKFILEQLSNVLFSAGYNFELASDGELAWNKYMANEDKYSLIISDVEMPKMDGLHLCKKIKENDERIPVFIFSSTMSKENREKALQVGASDTITKPEIHKLIPLIDKNLFF